MRLARPLAGGGRLHSQLATAPGVTRWMTQLIVGGGEEGWPRGGGEGGGAFGWFHCQSACNATARRGHTACPPGPTWPVQLRT